MKMLIVLALAAILVGCGEERQTLEKDHIAKGVEVCSQNSGVRRYDLRGPWVVYVDCENGARFKLYRNENKSTIEVSAY